MPGRKQTGKTRGALKTGDQGNHVATSLSADKLITLAEAAVVLRLSLDITRQLLIRPGRS